MPLYNNQPYMQGIAPNPLMQQQQFGAPDLHSQASGNSNEGSSGSDHRRANPNYKKAGLKIQSPKSASRPIWQVKQHWTRSRAVLPPAPSLSSVPQSYNPNYGIHPPRLNEMPTILTASRNSFRIACNNCPVDGFFIDHL
uniref:Uncharacterized protein n=1 Tax=Acrobeloides nanus TaxID=290746 RepID=A0A914D706_9BILA